MLAPLAADSHLSMAGAGAGFGHSPASLGNSGVVSTEPASIGGSKPGGHKEADGGWALSWCKDHYWGELIAVAAGTDGLVKVHTHRCHRLLAVFLTLRNG
jgi:hypothetical protein